MSQIFSFMVGVIVGMAAGLLYAPKSGEETRAELRKEAQAELQRLETEWRKRLDEINDTVEKTLKEITVLAKRAETGAEE